MASMPISALPSGPLGASGVTSLTSLQLKAKDPATQRQNLAQVCTELEGVFLSQLLQQMRKTFVTSADPRQKHTDYSHLYEQQVAQALAAGGGMGLARRLFEDMQNHIPANANLKEKQNNGVPTDSSSGDPAATGDLPVPGTPGLSGTGSPSPGSSPGGDHPEPGHG